MVKTLQKEIKELEKYKAKASKLYEKLTEENNFFNTKASLFNVLAISDAYLN
jgi:hypothetical protein